MTRDPTAIHLDAKERQQIFAMMRGQKTEYRLKQASIIWLLAEERRPQADVAQILGISSKTVRKWRGRFLRDGVSGLEDAPRSGAPYHFDAIQRSDLIVGIGERRLPSICCGLAGVASPTRTQSHAGDCAQLLTLYHPLVADHSSGEDWHSRTLSHRPGRDNPCEICGCFLPSIKVYHPHEHFCLVSPVGAMLCHLN